MGLFPLGLPWSLALASSVSIGLAAVGIPSHSISITALASIAVFISTITFDILVRDISRSHSIRSALDQYLGLNFLDAAGAIFFRKMVSDTKRVKPVQEEVLLDFLGVNAETEFGIRFGFKDIKSRENFIQKIPLTTYMDYEDYIVRMQDGEQNLLTKVPPQLFAVTSGTSGRASILPFLRKQRAIFFFRGITVMSRLMTRFFPATHNLRKGVKFFYSPRFRESKAGIPVGPNSSSPASTKSILHLYTTPKAGYEIASELDTLYVHLLFALKDKETGLIEANFASLIYFAFVYLESNWERLVEDIRDGRLREDMEISTDTRYALEDKLRPDRKRADELLKVFQQDFTGIASRIWPKMCLVLCVDSGAFESYAIVLREKYCKGLPVYSPLYAATEGLIGLNIWPTRLPSRYLLVPRAMFFELIPLANIDEPQPTTVFLEQAKVEETYELVLTNASGLCRYRFGDVIRVAAIYNQCPVVEFLYRKGQLLNVHGEKVSERILYEALKTAWDSAGIESSLVDYTTCESILLDPLLPQGTILDAPHYGIFVELPHLREDEEEADRLAFIVDQKLQDLSYVYKSYRAKNSIGYPQVFLLEPGSFAKLRQFLLSNTMASANQIKIPRVLRKPDQVEFLYSTCVFRQSSQRSQCH